MMVDNTQYFTNAHFNRSDAFILISLHYGVVIALCSQRDFPLSISLIMVYHDDKVKLVYCIIYSMKYMFW